MPTMLYIEAGEGFPAFKQQNILGSPSGELPEGLVQANLIFRSKATLKSSETPFRVKRDRGSEGEKIPSQPPPLRGTSFQRKEGKTELGPHPFEPTDPIDPIEPAPPSFIHNQRAIRPMG